MPCSPQGMEKSLSSGKAKLPQCPVLTEGRWIPSTKGQPWPGREAPGELRFRDSVWTNMLQVRAEPNLSSGCLEELMLHVLEGT